MKALKKNKKGQTMVEYILIIGLIAIALIIAISAMSNQVSNKFNTVGEEVEGAGGTTTTTTTTTN